MPRGRPRKVADQPLPMEVRLTPSDGEPIDFDLERLKELCARFAAFKEGGEETGPKLHYHCLFETVYTQPVMMTLFNLIVRADPTDKTKKGNAVVGAYRAQHEGSEGQAAKCGDCVYKHGYDDLWLQEVLAKNNAYWRNKEKVKKAKQRQAISTQEEAYKQLASKVSTHETANVMIYTLLDQYHSNQIRFPPKSVMESLVMRHMYDGQRHLVAAYQLKSFSQL